MRSSGIIAMTGMTKKYLVGRKTTKTKGVQSVKKETELRQIFKAYY